MDKQTPEYELVLVEFPVELNSRMEGVLMQIFCPQSLGLKGFMTTINVLGFVAVLIEPLRFGYVLIDICIYSFNVTILRY